MSLKTPEERYQEWLERLEIPIEETAEYEKFQKYLQDEFGLGDTAVEALWEATGYRYEDLLAVGIHSVTITYPWGRAIRYGIAGYPGLWGYEKMKELYAEIIG